MPVAEHAFGWTGSGWAFLTIAVTAFLVTWVFTDRLRVSRTGYIAVLALVVAALAGDYLAWSGTPATDLVSSGRMRPLLAGLAAAAIVAPLVGRLPGRPHPRGAPLRRKLAWEGFVYGSAEAVLLATLPVLVVWQAASAAGWTYGTWPTVASGALAIAGALFVILVHHLGYAEFRVRGSGRMLAGALFSCGLQGLAFLLTGNILAPLVAHVLLHGQMILRGVELPPATTGGELAPRVEPTVPVAG